MKAPKLDSPATTVVLMAVIALLLAMNFVTAQGGRPVAVTDAAAIQAVADATDRVAESNQAIAASLNRVADAITNLKIGAPAPAQQAPAPAAPAGEPAGAGNNSTAPPSLDGPQYEGQFQLGGGRN